ncbi:hypothetical protein NSE01_18050 [Novosphingobium sediminis]|uniref:Uncharacterized protein n=1 Tax=Novosphingobium sediminis TaxID=707214 RepID=A0A512AJY1_9SPHN|nr:hypothetical protein [Novosphingobium sediminis]GEN99972.1 hypothetical protein NSE01_18050 [Novosphingobium sediminis]
MKPVHALLSALAALQLAMPVQAAHPTMVALCGGGAPIPLPTKNNEADKQCCKICHSAMRKRFAGGTCCDGDDDEKDSGQ